jgi:putative restriction endonuclease
MTGEGLYVGVTDSKWFEFLRSRARFDEVNFWSPGASSFRALPGTPFLFKRKAPYNTIAGGGFVEYSEQMTIRDAWEYYGEKNGVASLREFVDTISRLKKAVATQTTTIGCRVLSEPFFLADGMEIAMPEDWSTQIVSGKSYARTDAIGARLWDDFLFRGAQLQPIASALAPFGGVGKRALYVPRRGQGTFRKLVLNAYDNRCAVTGERTLPVLQASHIRDFADVREHEIVNGLALRADIHVLFDRGYVTVSPDHRFLVSDALREDFSNGRVYYELHDKEVRLPNDLAKRPDPAALEWHFAERFKG